MEYYSLNQYMKDIFGTKVYKVAIDGGFTCPNRDGSLDTRGCIFCSGAGSGDFAQCRNDSITKQIDDGITFLSKKIKDGKYIAYFQAFTNTYGDVEQLRQKYLEAVKHESIVAISIATRPDCLSEEILQLLSEINKMKPVWVELGLQTIHPETARYIRRGYELSVFEEAVCNLKKLGMEVIVHVIFGLPFETRNQMLDTIRYIGKSGVDGIKIQLLHVIEGTDLAKEYREGKFNTLSMETYVELVADAISILPKNMVIHRMTGDGDKKTLIAPKWSMDKKRVLNALNKAISER